MAPTTDNPSTSTGYSDVTSAEPSRWWPTPHHRAAAFRPGAARTASAHSELRVLSTRARFLGPAARVSIATRDSTAVGGRRLAASRSKPATGARTSVAPEGPIHQRQGQGGFQQAFVLAPSVPGETSAVKYARPLQQQPPTPQSKKTGCPLQRLHRAPVNLSGLPPYRRSAADDSKPGGGFLRPRARHRSLCASSNDHCIVRPAEGLIHPTQADSISFKGGMFQLKIRCEPNRHRSTQTPKRTMRSRQ
jgi:hypothetical protein